MYRETAAVSRFCKIAKATISFVMYVCPSVHINISALTGRFSYFHTWEFLENLSVEF